MSFRIAPLLVVPVLGGTLAFERSVHAASYRHLDSVALRIQRQAAHLYREFGMHYRHVPEFRHLRADSLELYRLAAHIHELVHDNKSPRHLERDVRLLDRHFYHLQGLIHHISFAAHGHDLGHVHGDTSHVWQLLRQLERNIHRLRRTTGDLCYHTAHHSGLASLEGRHREKVHWRQPRRTSRSRYLDERDVHGPLRFPRLGH